MNYLVTNTRQISAEEDRKIVTRHKTFGNLGVFKYNDPSRDEEWFSTRTFFSDIFGDVFKNQAISDYYGKDVDVTRIFSEIKRRMDKENIKVAVRGNGFDKLFMAPTRILLDVHEYLNKQKIHRQMTANKLQKQIQITKNNLKVLETQLRELK